MARILYLFLVLLVALPIFALDGDFSPPGMTVGSNNSGLQLKFAPTLHSKAKSAKPTISISVSYTEYEATPATADEIPGLLADLRNESDEISGKAVARLAISGDKAVKPLAQLLTGEDRPRRKAAMALIGIGTAEATKALRAAPPGPFLADLENDDPPMQMLAAFLLACVGDKSVVEKLTAKMQSDEVGMILIPVMMGFTQNPSVKALPLIEEYLTHDNPGVRAFTIFIVAGVSGKQAFDKVVPMLGDSDEIVHLFTVMALAAIEDKRTIPILCHVLQFDEHAEARAFAALKLGETKDAKYLPLLIQRLQKEEDPKGKLFIVLALDQMPKTPECLAALMVASKDENEDVRKAAEAMLKEKTETK